MGFLSRFGSGNQNNVADFVKVTFSDDINKASTWNAETKTCTGVTGLDIKVLTSMAGFQSNMQKFIVGVKVEPIVDKWTFSAADASAEQSFQHRMFISFIDTYPNQLLLAEQEETQFILPKLPT